MALSTTTNKAIHNGNASATVFPYAFPILAASHLAVIYTDADDVETTLSPSEYSVTGIGSPSGGNVTYAPSGAPIATGTKLTLVRTVPYTQETVFSNQGGYYPEIVEARFDLVYMAVQQLAEIVSRAVVGSVSDPATEQSNYALIQSLQAFQGGIDKLTTAGDILSHTGSAYARFARGNPGQFLGVSGGDLAWQTPSFLSFSGVRQTVSGGPVTTAGLPNILGTNPSGPAITTANVSAIYPLVATAANGWSAATGGPVDAIGYSSTNLTWTGLTLSRAAATPNFLYVTIANGVMTTGATVRAPIYQEGGTPATTNGQFTFNIGEMRGYLGNGTTAPQVNLVMVGEAATDGTGVISTVTYAYNGRYESAFTATLPAGATEVSHSHNLGVYPKAADWFIECTTTDLGYAVGERISVNGQAQGDNGTAPRMNTLSLTNKVSHLVTPGNPWQLLTKTTGILATATLASWKYKAVAERGW